MSVLVESLINIKRIIVVSAMLLAGFPVYQWWAEADDRALQRAVLRVEVVKDCRRISSYFRQSIEKTAFYSYRRHHAKFGLNERDAQAFVVFVMSDYFKNQFARNVVYTMCGRSLRETEDLYLQAMNKFDVDRGRSVVAAYAAKSGETRTRP
ncbi:MAG: hypothetical protein AAGC70_09540 [Pseudomonadota bacterium]